jgi:hypothetical protein
MPSRLTVLFAPLTSLHRRLAGCLQHSTEFFAHQHTHAVVLSRQLLRNQDNRLRLRNPAAWCSEVVALVTPANL